MIDPRGMEMSAWCNQTALALSSFGPLPSMRPEDNWKAWALAVLSLPGITSFAPPNPSWFEDWADWATRFIQAVPL